MEPKEKISQLIQEATDKLHEAENLARASGVEFYFNQSIAVINPPLPDAWESSETCW